MKIICITQVFNEMQTGCLPVFIKYSKNLFDEQIIYDDASTDGSLEYAKEHVSLVLRGKQNEFQSELMHKRKLIAAAEAFQPDIIVTLDADEILLLTRMELEGICSELIKCGLDGYSCEFINLWRSRHYKRVDSLFDEFAPVKLWRHKPNVEPFPNLIKKLHQPGHPEYVKAIENHEKFRILHTGFMTRDQISRKFFSYRKHGQRGFELARFFDESNLKTERVDPRTLPDDWCEEEEAPTPLSIAEYFTAGIDIQNSVLKPKYSIICLIYKDINWLQFVYKQLIKYTSTIDLEIIFVANNATECVKRYLYENYLPHVIFESDEKHKNEYYINKVYRAYNFGVKNAQGDIVILINSDMAFSPGWLENLVNKHNGQNCVASRLVERGRLATGKHGLEKDFGDDYFSYKEADFLTYAQNIRENKDVAGGLYMPLLVNRRHFLDVGGYPEGNILPGTDIFNPEIAEPNTDVISGDAAFIQKLSSRGIDHVTSFDSIVYHFQEGEKQSTIEKDACILEKKSVVVCNDILTGSMGEKVFWDHILEKPNTIGLSHDIVGGRSTLSFEEYISENTIDVLLVVQNATFLPKLFKDMYTISFLQDDLRRMNRTNLQQEKNLSSSQCLVTNSIYTASSYFEYPFTIIPIGIDHALFRPRDKSTMREKWRLPKHEKIGIFVGALNEVKGWSEVLDIIKKETEIFWIVVTKYKTSFTHPRVQLFTKCPQEILSELLCAADFFILGSKVETQCLAAIEAALCDLPIVMHRTGVFNDINQSDLKEIGYFGNDLVVGIDIVLSGTFSPRKTILNYALTIEASMSSWHRLISRNRIHADSLVFGTEVELKNKYRNPPLSLLLEILLRKKILKKLLGRDSFYSVAELSVSLKNILPKAIFNSLRWIWRISRRKIK